MTIVLVGGGPDTVTDPAVVAPFLASLRVPSGAQPRVAYILFDDAGSGPAFLPGYVALLSGVDHEVVPVWAGPGVRLTAEALADVDAVVVGGGPTPGYHASLEPTFGAIRDLVRRGGSYLGFSAGAMIAPASAVLGGYRVDGVEVCPEEWGEGLEEVTLSAGIGLVPFPVGVHVGQAGTLGVLVALGERGAHPRLLGVDEDTSVVVEPDGTWTRHGRGAVWEVSAADGTVTVRRRTG